MKLPNGEKKPGDSSIENIIYMALKQQKEEFKHDLDVDAVFKQIMKGQYEHMPAWAQKQCWNVGYKMKGMKEDPRADHEIVDAKKAKLFLASNNVAAGEKAKTKGADKRKKAA
ncbi:hypothetical protein D3C87_1735190 [compost metagenome]